MMPTEVSAVDGASPVSAASNCWTRAYIPTCFEAGSAPSSDLIGALINFGGGAVECTVNLSSNSKTLRTTGFGFQIPTTPPATINGVLVRIRRLTSGEPGDKNHDKSVRLLKDRAPTGEDYAAAGEAWIGFKKDDACDPNKGSHTYGACNDTWDAQWSVADINAAGFGVDFVAHNNYPSGNAGSSAYVDYVQIMVYFCE